MNNLEEFLRKEGVLLHYLKNFDYSFSPLDVVYLYTSFRWENTPEGHIFWNKLYNDASNLYITKSKIQELQREYKLIPPRYKEIL